MIITSLEELRLAAPTHALDSFNSIIGVIDNTEHDVLEEKLGTPLYLRLCQWYNDNSSIRSMIVEQVRVKGTYTNPSAWNHLWLISLRVVAYSALARSVGQQTVSVNNAGLNQFSADGYQPATKDAIDTYRQANIQEAAAACNQLLRLLERWTKAVGHAETTSGDSSDSSTPDDEEQREIVSLWRQSRYFYLSTQLLIPTATCLQQYINFLENRERFIQMLPDLLFIQEEIITNSVGEDFLQWLVKEGLKQTNGDTPISPIDDNTEATEDSKPVRQIIQNVIHRLRKVMAAQLVTRTIVLKFNREQKQQAHDDSVRMLDVACTYIRTHQKELISAGAPLESGPLFISGTAQNLTEDKSAKTSCHVACCDNQSTDSNDPTAINNRPGAAAFFTPPIL